MDPVFKLKLCYPDGKAVVFKGDSTFERNLVASIATQVAKTAVSVLVDSIIARGVGFGRTEAHVKQDATDALRELLPRLTKDAVEAVLLELKTESVKAL